MVLRPRDLPTAVDGETVDVLFEGETLAARPGEPLMATLLAHGFDIASRSVKYHRPRGAFCLGGTCGQCWMRIDDIPNRAACTTPARKGMVATRENAFPSADHDLFRAADLVFPQGLDHHRLGTTPVRAVNSLIGGTARQLAGLGALSDRPAPPPPVMKRVSAEIVVIGAGPAGMAAALAAARAGAGVLMLEKRREIGGHLNTGLFDGDPEYALLPKQHLEALRDAGAVGWSRAHALGIFATGGGGREVLVRRGGPQEHLVRVRPEVLILATGGYEQAGLFANNDLPGHYAARGVAKLILHRGVRPGRRAVIIDAQPGGETGWRLQRRLTAVGIEATRLCTAPTDHAPTEGALPSTTLVGATVIGARGRTRVKGVEISIRGEPRARRTLPCDLLISALPPSPSYELAHQAGCSLAHRPELGGFPVVRDPGTGATSVEGIFTAGDLSGTHTAREAMRDGVIAGLSAALLLADDQVLRHRRDDLAAQARGAR